MRRASKKKRRHRRRSKRWRFRSFRTGGERTCSSCQIGELRGEPPGLPRAKLVHVRLPLFEQARLRVEDAIMKRRPPERLSLDHDAAELPLLEAALLLHRAQELLAMEM